MIDEMDCEHGLPNVLEYLQQTAWALEPGVMQRMLSVFGRRMNGVRLSDDEVRVVTGRGPADRGRPSDSAGYQVAGSDAIVPITGILAKHSRMVNGTSQPRGTSLVAIEEDLSRALGDPAVRRIVLRIDSPGGSVEGLCDAGDRIWQASQQKPVDAVIEEIGASAAYWLASQANRVYANQSARVGSIGVYTVIADTSGVAEKMGVRFHLVASGRHKGVGTPGIPIDDDHLAAIASEVGDYYEMFKRAVSRGRGAAGLAGEALEQVADGRVFVGDRARQMKLIDGIRTFSQVASARPGRARTAVSAAAAADAAGLAATCDTDEIDETGEPTHTTGPAAAGAAGDEPMTEQNEPAATPDAEQIRADTETASRERMDALQAAFPTDTAYAVEQWRAGATVEQAKLAHYDQMAGQVADLTSCLETAEGQVADLTAELEAAKAGPAAKGPRPAGKASAPAAPAGAAGGDGGTMDFPALAREMAAREGISRTAAMRKLVVAHPTEHAVWQASQASVRR